MKRKLALMLCGVLVMSLMAGCGTEDEVILFPLAEESTVSTQQTDVTESTVTEPAESETEIKEEPKVEYPVFEVDAQGIEVHTTELPGEEIKQGAIPGISVSGMNRIFFQDSPYVLVYNPALTGDSFTNEELTEKLNLIN